MSYMLNQERVTPVTLHNERKRVDSLLGVGRRANDEIEAIVDGLIREVEHLLEIRELLLADMQQAHEWLRSGVGADCVADKLWVWMEDRSNPRYDDIEKVQPYVDLEPSSPMPEYTGTAPMQNPASLCSVG